MDLKKSEEIYGKLTGEDDNFYYFEGKKENGVTVPKNAFWTLVPEDPEALRSPHTEPPRPKEG